MASPIEIERAMQRSLNRSIDAKGELEFPAVPAELDNFLGRILRTIDAVGVTLTKTEAREIRRRLNNHLEEAHKQNSGARVRLKFKKRKGTAVELKIKTIPASSKSKYDDWRSKSTEPFGRRPDCMVMRLAKEVAANVDREQLEILDIGAGTGRNSIPLARLGHQVDALEMTPRYCQDLEDKRDSEKLPLAVLPMNLLDGAVELKADHYDLVVLAQVLSDQANVQHMRSFLEKISRGLKVGGRLVAMSFLPDSDELVDEAWRQIAHLKWSGVFTRAEFDSVMIDTSLSLVECTPVFEYEQQNSPEGDWPPTKWYEQWSKGRDLFRGLKDAPMRAYWIQFERVADAEGVKLMGDSSDLNAA